MKVNERFGSLTVLTMNVSLEVFYLSKILGDCSTMVNLKIVGHSMMPTFYENDIVKVKSCTRYRLGDIVIYPACHGQSIIIHRIIGKWKKRIITKGDGNVTYDVPISDRIILGRVIIENENTFSRIMDTFKSIKMMKMKDINNFLHMLYIE